MITKTDLTSDKNGRMKAEYTCDCGWIDWNHAVADRQDLVRIWSQLPHAPRAGLRTSTLVRVPMRKIHYFKVSFDIDQSWRQKLVSLGIGAKTRFTFYVLDKGTGAAAWPFYKQAALHIYMMGCCVTESIQLFNFDWKHKSGFSMEDLASNLLAFYMHVEGLSREDIVRKSGGWVDARTAKQKSLAVFEAMERNHRTQPKGFQWFQASLFNDLVPLRPADKRSGWHSMPQAFQGIKPIAAACYIPPAPLLSESELRMYA
jgi:hypothetical protein